MGPLSRGVVGESRNHEEEMLFETQSEIRKLIEQLESKDENET